MTRQKEPWFPDPLDPNENDYPDRSEIRKFASGATRDTEKDKLDYEGFLSPLVLKAYAEYMHKHRIQKDGKIRDSDNWQKMFGDKHLDVCIKSLFRHFMDLWLFHRGSQGRETIEEALAGIIFNASAYWFNLLKNGGDKALAAKASLDDLPEKMDVVGRMMRKLEQLYAFMASAEEDLSKMDEKTDPYVRIATRKQWLSAIRAATDTEAILLARGTRAGAKQIDLFKQMEATVRQLREKGKK